MNVMPPKPHETPFDASSPEAARLREDGPDGLTLVPIADEDALPDHSGPSFSQMLAHSRLLLSWRSGDFFEERRRLMSAERFTFE